MREATPQNAPGDFYVAKDRCITCGAPEAEAPALMGFDDAAQSCYFRRQPATPAEVEQAIRAVWVSCCEAVRYQGVDPEVQRRLIALGGSASIDVPIERLTPRDDGEPSR
jgi:hypothetical protein